MGKSSKKSSVQVAAAPSPVPVEKSGKKGKRAAAEVIEKEVSTKKQKKEVQEAPNKVGTKKVPEPKKKPQPKKQEKSSEEDSSSDEQPVAKTVAAPAVKNGTVGKKEKHESSSSEDSSSDDEEPVKTVAQPKKVVDPVLKKAVPVKKESSSSEDASSDDEKPVKTAPQAKKVVAPIAKKAVPGKKESSSSEDSSSDEEDVKPVQKVTAAALKKKQESSDSSEDDSSSDDDVVPTAKVPVKTGVPLSSKKKEESSESESGDSSEDDSEEEKLAKKGKSDSDDSEDSSDESDGVPQKKKVKVEPVKKQVSKPASKGDETDSSSDDDSSESDDDEDEKPTQTPKKKSNDVEMKDVQSTATKLAKAVKSPVTPPSQSTGSKTLFAGNLSYELTEDDVIDFFKGVGDVVAVRLTSDADGRSKGFGHIEFASETDAKNAVDELNGAELLGRSIKLDFARERGAYTPRDRSENNSFQKGDGKGASCTAFVKGFDKSHEEDQIRSSLEEHFADCGEITRVSIPKDYETGASKGIAYIDFSDADALAKALELNGSSLNDYTLTVDEAKPKGDGGGRGGGRFSGGRSGGRDGGRFSGGRSFGRDGGGRFGGRGGGGRFGGRGGGRDSGGRGRGGRGRGFKPSMATHGTGKKTTFSQD